MFQNPCSLLLLIPYNLFMGIDGQELFGDSFRYGSQHFFRVTTLTLTVSYRHGYVFEFLIFNFFKAIYFILFRLVFVSLCSADEF